MSNPQEICVVTAGGSRYDIWEIVEVHRSSLSETVNHAMLTVSEISTGGASFSDIKLSPGDQASITLGGVKVIDGVVYLRQAAYDDKSHAVQIGIASKSEAILRTTVDVKPGQYTNQTIQQIGSSCFGKVGVGFNVKGSPPGADMIFKRVSEQLGETRHNFIERLCRLRNLHLIDDGQGSVSAFRGPQGRSSQLVEGENILRARLLLSFNEMVTDVKGISQNSNPDSGPGGAQIKADASVPSPLGGNTPSGTYKFGAEDAGSQPELQMRVNHQVDHIAATTVDGMITVQGWFRPEGDLWFNHVLDWINVYSPMLIPQKSMDFAIKEVIHRQSSQEGTTTDILITNSAGLGSQPLLGLS